MARRLVGIYNEDWQKVNNIQQNHKQFGFPIKPSQPEVLKIALEKADWANNVTNKLFTLKFPSRTMPRRTNKRGSVFDLIMIIVVLAVLASVLLLSNMIANTANTQLINQLNDTNVNASLTQITNAVNSTDSITLIILAGLIIGMFISAIGMFFDTAFAVIFLLFTIIATIVAIPISNYYSYLITNPTLAPIAAAYYPITNLIMSQLPIIIFVLGIITLIVTYAKSNIGGANA
jgi:hypothetical protein